MSERAYVRRSGELHVTRRRWGSTLAMLVAAALALAARPAAARTIGPDAFGYFATDEVPFAFEDVAATGTRTLAGTEDATFTAPLGFTFHFYGASHDAVTWSSNGLMTFGTANSGAGNVDLSTAAPGVDSPSIAVLWDDWRITDPRFSAVFHETRGAPGSRRFIVQWQNAFPTGFSFDAVTFQAVLHEGSNHIELRYLDAETDNLQTLGGSATAGIRDTAGHTNGRSLVWSFDAPSIASGHAIRFAVPADTSPPAVSISSPADGAFVAVAQVTLVAAVSDESATSVSATPGGAVMTLPAGGGDVSASLSLVEGDNVLAVSATDAAGNVGGSSVTVTLDSIRPSINAITPADGAVVGESLVAISFNVVDATATTVSFAGIELELQAGGGAVSHAAFLSEGRNDFAISVTDAAGNSTTASLRLTLDTSSPVVTIDTPANGSCFGPGQSLAGVVVTVSDATATEVSSTARGISSLQPPGGGVIPGFQPLAEGANEIRVSATDATGRSSSASITVYLDSLAPTVGIDSPADGSAVRGSVELAASAGDGVQGCGLVRVDLLVDGAAAASLVAPPYSAWIDSTLLSDGLHAFSAVAVDVHGSSASSSVEIVVDNTPPAVAFLAPADGAAASGTIALSVEAIDGDGSGLTLVEVLAAGRPTSTAGAVAYDPPVAAGVVNGEEDTTRWPDGPLSFTARAVDAAGNEGVASVSVVVANAIPAAITISPASGSVVSGEIPITVEAPGADVEALEVLVDGVAFGTSATSPFHGVFDSADRLDGSMTVSAVARRHGGASTSAAVVVTVDNLSFHLLPNSFHLDSRAHGVVLAHVRGDSARLLLPVKKSEVRLVVPGGSPVRAIAGAAWGGHRRCGRERDVHAILAFDRARLLASIEAGIAAGAIDPNAGLEVALVAADDLVQDTTLVRVHSQRHGWWKRCR